MLVKRQLELDHLRSAIASVRRGVIALVGRAGHGKSTLVDQLIFESPSEIALHSAVLGPHGYEPLPQLEGVTVLDDAWLFSNAQEEIADHVRRQNGLVIIVCLTIDQAQSLYDDDLAAIVPVPHWSARPAVEHGVEQTSCLRLVQSATVAEIY